MVTIICMVGLPRSGKSSWSKKTSKFLSCPVVNCDSIRLALHGHKYIEESEPYVHVIKDTMVKSFYHYGYDYIIVDECHVKKLHRSHWKELLPNAEVRFKYINTPELVCIERAMSINYDKLVPVIQRMNQEFETLENDEILWDLTI